MDRLKFYRKCYEDCKLVIADLMKREDLSEEKKEVLIDQFLTRMNELKAMIEELEDLYL